MSKDFPEMRQLLSSSGLPPKSERQTLMFSATFAKRIQKIAREHLEADYAFVKVGVIGGANMDITQEFILVCTLWSISLYFPVMFNSS